VTAGYTQTQPSLPWSGDTVTSRHASYRAAVHASRTHTTKTAIYLDWLRQVGRATDAGAVEALRYPIQTICSVRNTLKKAGLVRADGEAMGAYGVPVTLWAPVERAAR
jgi:hypothetical protein